MNYGHFLLGLLLYGVPIAKLAVGIAMICQPQTKPRRRKRR